jgi:RNA polymerase sigma-70 factor (ECF subfamily)
MESSRPTLEHLLDAHLDALYRTALRLCGGHAADAEDLVHDAVARAVEGYAELREHAAARSWLFTTLVRTHLNRGRARRRRRESLAVDLSDAAFEEALANWRPARSPLDDAARADVRDRVIAALHVLDEAYRTVVWLVDAEEWRLRDVATMLDVPEGTVASRLYRGRQTLRAALQRREKDLTA